MEKLINKILSFRGDEWRPFAIEVSQDDIRLAVFGGALGFAEPPTAETAPHQDIESCLLEGITLLEEARLLSPSREPYHRLPHHRCVFFKGFKSPKRCVELRRPHLLRAVPRIGDRVRFSGRDDAPHNLLVVKQVDWNLDDDETHLWSAHAHVKDGKLDARVAVHIENGWQPYREFKYSNPSAKTKRP